MAKLEKFDLAMVFLAKVVGFGLVLASVAAWVFQAYWFLRYGHWTSLDITRLLAEVGDPPGLRLWAMAPATWIGLHKILSWIPVPIFVGGLGVWIMAKVNFHS